MSLAKKAAGGFAFATLANVGSRLLTIGSTFLLTRYLVPAVQGEVNLAYVFISTAGAATAFGVMQFVASRPKEGRDTAFHGSVLVLSAGAIACVGCVATGHYVADWLKVPGMLRYIPGMALAHYLERLQWLPRSILVREMRFRTAGTRVALGELAFAFSSVTLAHLGWGGSAIVGGNIVRGVVGIAFLLAVTDWRDYLTPCRLTLNTMAKLLRFGLPFTIASFFYIGATSWDNSFMGFRFGEATVGIYNQAYRLAELPVTSVSDQINDVLVPTFARLDDPDARRRAFFRAASLTAIVVFPMAAGLAAIAPTLVEVFYPSSYAGVAPFLMVLASLAIARSFRNLAASLLQVVGRTGGFVFIDLFLVVGILGIMALLAPFGAVWASSGVGIAFMLSLVLSVRLLRPDGIKVSAFFLAVFRPLLSCIPLAFAVVGLRTVLPSASVPGFVRLLIELGGGAIAYIGASLVFAPKISQDFIALAMGVMRRGQPVKAGENA